MGVATDCNDPKVQPSVIRSVSSRKKFKTHRYRTRNSPQLWVAQPSSPILRELNASGYLGKSDAFDEALATFSVAYADQNEKDHSTQTRDPARQDRGGHRRVKVSRSQEGNEQGITNGQPNAISAASFRAFLYRTVALGADWMVVSQVTPRPGRGTA